MFTWPVTAVAPVRVTLNTADVVPLLPSRTVASPMEKTGGGSSFRMVPTPVPLTMIAHSIGEDHVDGLGCFINQVAQDRDGQDLVALARGERQGAVSGEKI